MRLSQRAYPHPVVGNGDDVVDAEFQAPIEVQHAGTTFDISVEVQCSSKTVHRLIAKGDAVFVLHVECSNTLYRQAFEFPEASKVFKVPAENLNATVDVNVFARATREIRNYTVEGAHPDYGASRFQVGAGDIIAVAEGSTFDADIDYDALRMLSSIMQVCRNPAGADSPMKVDTSGEKITIFLSPEDFDDYKLVKLNPPLVAALIPSLVLPALIYALREIQSGGPHIEDLRWCRCLKRRMECLGLDPQTDTLEAAQKVLELPIRRALSSAKTLLDNMS